MSGYDISLALVIPDALRVKANLLACALGYDALPGNTYSVALSEDGTEPETHWGCHAWVQQTFIDILLGAEAGNLPPIEWELFQLTEQDVLEILSAMIVSPPQYELLDFDEWLSSHSLMRVEYEEASP